jgi:hypothetical protein
MEHQPNRLGRCIVYTVHAPFLGSGGRSLFVANYFLGPAGSAVPPPRNSLSVFGGAAGGFGLAGRPGRVASHLPIENWWDSAADG